MLGVIHVFIVCAILSNAWSWHTCKDESFCALSRNRDTSRYLIKPQSIALNETAGTLSAKLLNSRSYKEFDLELNVYDDEVVRVTIHDPAVERKSIPSVIRELPKGKFRVEINESTIKLLMTNSTLYMGSEYFNVEIWNCITNQTVYFNKDQDLHLGSDHAVKVTFENTQNAYGIPQHSDRLKLKDTKNGEPYRLFNLNNDYSQGGPTQSLHGSVPVLYAHGRGQNGGSHVAGVFWNNPAQTFVDLDHSNNTVSADFMTEAGTLDVFLIPGHRHFKDTVVAYSRLTGSAPLPPLFALGYHQSRNSYPTQKDLLGVAHGLQDGNFPVDAVWLHNDQSDGHRYFTWNYSAFPEPFRMQDELEKMGMYLVTIIPPHIKVKKGYSVYDEMKTKGFYVRNSEGTIFEGICWPGLSSYVDFLNPDALEWWGSLFDYHNYPNTSSIVHIWNALNEPVVFDMNESTMPRNNRHHGNILHKEVHNIYGHLQVKGTFSGLVARDYIKQRPFILTRSHFAGTQNYAAVGTGAQRATWTVLQVSIQICLAEALAGISFCGADVGGYTGRPTDELLQRWYQLGAWYPFFRAHSGNQQPNREPFLYFSDVQERIRTSIHQRYAHLPYWYTQWYQHELYGEPVLRPLVYNYPEDDNVTDIDHEFMIGSDILVAPVLQPSVDTHDVYLPSRDVWYYLPTKDKADFRAMSGDHKISVDLNSSPVFYRAGSIIIRRDTPRAATKLMKDDPYDFYIFTNRDKIAESTLYEDDNISYDYRSDVYNYYSLTFAIDTLQVKPVKDSSYSGKFSIGSVYIFYDRLLTHLYSSVLLSADGNHVKYPVVCHGDWLKIDFNKGIRDKTLNFTLV